jgi:hypothetical protein
MLASFQRPDHGDISILEKRGHFYLGLTSRSIEPFLEYDSLEAVGTRK